MPESTCIIENILLVGYLREHENLCGNHVPNLVRKNINLYMKQYSLHPIGQPLDAAESLAEHEHLSQITELYRADIDAFCAGSAQSTTSSRAVAIDTDLCRLRYGPIQSTVTNMMSSIPTALSKLLIRDKVIDLKMGHKHALLLTTNGSVHAMGSNDSGQCGVGEDVQFLKSPMRITFDHLHRAEHGGTTISSMACGKLHSLFLDQNGTLLVCGYNYCGQLGLGHGSSPSTDSPDFTPLELVGFDTISEDDASSDEDDDAPFEDAYGQVIGLQSVSVPMLYESEESDSMEMSLGDLECHDFYQRLESVPRPKVNQFFVGLGVSFGSVHCGAYHSLCITTEGDCYTFGHNGFGNLGNGTHTTWGEGESTPYRVPSPHSFVDASCGSDHSVLLTDRNQLVSFGDNTYSQCSTAHGQTAKVSTPVTLSKEREFGLSEDRYVEKVIAFERQTLVVVDVFKRCRA